MFFPLVSGSLPATINAFNPSVTYSSVKYNMLYMHHYIKKWIIPGLKSFFLKKKMSRAHIVFSIASTSFSLSSLLYLSMSQGSRSKVGVCKPSLLTVNFGQGKIKCLNSLLGIVLVVTCRFPICLLILCKHLKKQMLQKAPNLPLHLLTSP